MAQNHFTNPQGNYIPPYQNQPQGLYPTLQSPQPQNIQYLNPSSQTQVFLTKIQQLDDQLEKSGLFVFRGYLYFILLIAAALTGFALCLFPWNPENNAFIAILFLMIAGINIWTGVLGLKAIASKDFIQSKLAFALFIINCGLALIFCGIMVYVPSPMEVKVASTLPALIYGIGIFGSKKVDNVLSERDSVSKAMKAQEKLENGTNKIIHRHI